MPRSRRLRGRSRPRSAPPAPRSTGAGARPPLPPGPRRTGGSGRPVGGGGGGTHTDGMGAAGRALQRGLPAALATRAGNYSSPFNYLSAPSSSSRADAGAGGGRPGGAAPLSAGSGWSPGAGCPQSLPSPPPPGRGSPAPAPFAAPRRAARHRRPLPGLDGGRHVGGPQGAGGCGSAPAPSAVPQPSPLPARLRSPQGSVPARPRSPHRSRPRPPRQRGAPGRGSSAPAPPLRPLSPPAPRSSPYLLTVELTAVFVS